ncbi:hypothetical protein LTR56_026090 [Elasticomyces elasticus]|nr:hypothetical protein LTR56_026090 [Elasticomyces elasticus]KAK4903818.1 hypothetical protein LTR49_026618 [Elasticomyces elasticus]KAK5738098.1 hypothetical protein LTS12_025690 [Elasticomyces elasticus]
MATKTPNEALWVEGPFHSTQTDEKEMLKMGAVQCLKRNFGLAGMLGVSSNIIVSPEYMLVSLNFVIYNGGSCLLLLGPFLALPFVWCNYASLMQLVKQYNTTSIVCKTKANSAVYRIPNAGGQFVYVSALLQHTRGRVSMPLSYFVGWLGVIGWQAFVTAICYGAATMTQGLVSLLNPSYVPQAWHGVLLTLLILVLAFTVNVLGTRELKWLEGCIGVLRIFNFVTLLVVISVYSPHASIKTVLSDHGSGGWSNSIASTLVGLPNFLFAVTGLDSIGHLGEETKNAAEILPKSMKYSVAANYLSLTVISVTLAFCVGDARKLLATDTTGYVFITLVHNAFDRIHRRSAKGATAAVVSVIIVANFAAAIAGMTTASRQCWALARAFAVPGHWLRNIHDPALAKHWYNRYINTPIPPNVLVLITVSCGLLCLIGLGSTVALNSYNSLAANALIISYVICHICMLFERRRWSWAMIYNVVFIGGGSVFAVLAL